jgi:hypothetical protein
LPATAPLAAKCLARLRIRFFRIGAAQLQASSRRKQFQKAARQRAGGMGGCVIANVAIAESP